MSFADPTLSWCCALGSHKSPHYPRGQCPKATTLAVTASKNPSSPLHYLQGNTMVRVVGAKKQPPHHQTTTTTSRKTDSYARQHSHDQDADHQQQEEDDALLHHVPFSNIDPADPHSNQLAADNLLRIASGQTARDVTHRLTKKAAEAHKKEMDRVRSQHCIKRTVAVRDSAQLDQYVQNMLAKGQERRRKELTKIEKEMYPVPQPRISQKSKELVRLKREEERAHGQPVTRVEDRFRTSPRRCRSASAAAREREMSRRRMHDFRPAGLVHHDGCEDVFLISGPTPRCPSPRPSAPMTDEQRLARFVELSRPRTNSARGAAGNGGDSGSRRQQ